MTTKVVFASALALTLTGCISRNCQPGLVFYCTFDDKAAISAPAVGLAGKAIDPAFGEGFDGMALCVMPRSNSAEFDFPHGLPTEQWCIEFDAKLYNANDFYIDGGDPLIFTFYAADDVTRPVMFDMGFNSNNGAGKSGLVIGVPFACPLTTSDTYVGRGNYSQLLGPDVKGWHHYKVCFNRKGLDGSSNAMAVFLDGRLLKKGLSNPQHIELTERNVSRPLKLAFSSINKGLGKSPFRIDEFKIWDTDKYSVEVNP